MAEFDWQLTGVTHSKAYGDGLALCEGYLHKDGTVFVRREGSFGSLPQKFSIEDARVMSLVLAAIVAEYDEFQVSLTKEYGPAQ